MGSYRLLEHTADMGIEATGESMEELFVQAACGLREIITSLTRGEAREERTVEVEGGDREELLVNWLNEILFLFESRGFFPADFAVEEVGPAKLRGKVWGEPFDPQRHLIEREIKAVTHHQLSVQRTDGGWRARIFVDL